MSVFFPIRRALISVSDKTNLLDLASALAKKSVVLLSTGGTAKLLRDAGFSVTDVADVTGFPEMMDGRVKTLHPKIHGGLLALRDEKTHTDALAEHGIEAIDLVVVNLYPFENSVALGKAEHELIENIDIGGPSMIRSAAKNFQSVAVLTDPDQYFSFIESFNENGGLNMIQRKALASAAFARTASYDSAISGWFSTIENDFFPQRFTIATEKLQTLRYGENPHQKAAFYSDANIRTGLANAVQHQGKELSYNNILDLDSAISCVAEFDEPAVAIIKHANPCGVAAGANLLRAYQAALASDPLSAFGGIVACNRILDGETAKEISTLFVEVIAAPKFSEEAKNIFATKKNLRLLEVALPNPTRAEKIIRSVSGGFLIQESDAADLNPDNWRVVSKRTPAAEEMRDLLFALRVCRHTRSNAIVLAKNAATIGIGGGVTSRVDAVNLAVKKASDCVENPTRSLGAVIASDAFFPFSDGLLAAAKAGIKAAIHPGGSVRDQEVIDAADANDIAMVFCEHRHFRH
jgi:phosphoribosylaminoimidazolecarboxamide formyltransferase/IMP cyclohydrolase